MFLKHNQRVILNSTHLRLDTDSYPFSCQATFCLRSEHPDCKSRTSEVYRTTSRTIPLSVESTDRDQTQLMIKRVILLRKLSEVVTNSVNRLLNHIVIYQSDQESSSSNLINRESG